MVVGPSGEAVRVGTGLGTAARLRTTLGPGASTGATGGASTLTSSGFTSMLGASTAGATGALGGFTTLVVRTDASGVASLVASGALAGFAASPGSTTRRSPSASARRRMRSACASSMDADGLDAPMPSFWASASNSLLVSPSSFESSCTRIFFCAKTFP
jgi:hypothetical protein